MTRTKFALNLISDAVTYIFGIVVFGGGGIWLLCRGGRFIWDNYPPKGSEYLAYLGLSMIVLGIMVIVSFLMTTHFWIKDRHRRWAS